MRTYLDCIPCFFKQALAAERLAGADEITQKKILNEIAEMIPDISLEDTPPEMGRKIYNLISKITKKEDPFREIKKKSNEFALGLYPELKNKVKNSKDSLLTAIRIAITGNVIDYGVSDSFDIGKELKEIETKKFAIFDYEYFKKMLRNSQDLLWLADNAGEVVFDKILIEEIKKINPLCNIIYAVREKPIINDALEEDAYFARIDKLTKIISSGCDAPGTILSLCSKKFLDIFNEADMIISKGQGNFESLSNIDYKCIFFLFKAKCSVIANDIGVNVGDIVLKESNCKP
jgi:hypothetical protein